MSPLTVAPPRIEQSDFAAGWCPDLELGSIPNNGLLEVMNLLPDIVTGQPQTRFGFKRLANLAKAGFTAKSIHPYNKANGTQCLIIVFASGTDVEVWQYNLKTAAAVKISPALKVWLSLDGVHYGFTVDDVFYGGSEKDPMYSWNGTTFDETAGEPTQPATWDAGTAYRKGTVVYYLPTTKVYSSNVNWVKQDWEASTSYSKGDQVSHVVGGATRTYKSRKDHDSAGGNAPGTSSAHWKHMKMKPPVDGNGKITEHWTEVPLAPKTNVATFHHNRMFARHDNSNVQRLIFSEQAKMMPDEILESVSAQWSAKSWRITGEVDGAGFQDFKTEGADPITALHSYGYNLVVFKRRSTHVIAGHDPRTWHPRQIGYEGCIGPNAKTEFDGLVYFVSDQGFNVTDGTEIKPAPGSDKIQDYIRDAVSWDGTNNVTMWTFDNFIWISLPTMKSKTPNRVLVYDPSTGSFWKQDLHVQCAAVNNVYGVDQLYFGVPTKTGTFTSSAYAWSGTAHESSSTNTYNPTVTNLFKNASFERVFTTGNYWTKTSDTNVSVHRTNESVYKGQYGLEITNAKSAANPHGIQQVVGMTSVSNHRIRIKARRPNWQKWPDAEPQLGIYVDGVSKAVTWEKVGRGWWKGFITEPGAVGNKTISFRVDPNRTVQVDMAMCYVIPAGTEPGDFDGDSGEDRQVPPAGPGTEVADTGTFEGGSGLVMQYRHPDSPYTDDTAQVSYVSQAITWWLRTAWFSFSSAKEIRRVRRTWCLVRGAVTATLRGFRNFGFKPEFEVSKTTATGDEATHFEGRVIDSASSVNYLIEGVGAPATVLGVASDTEFRRDAYHQGV